MKGVGVQDNSEDDITLLVCQLGRLRWTQSSYETCGLPRSTIRKDLKSKEKQQWTPPRVIFLLEMLS